KSLKDWKKEDVIGSPFAIDDYEVNPLLGSMDDLKNLHESLNKKGLKLVLDFVPNHFSAGSKLLKSNPELFLFADEELFNRDPYTFFKTEDSDSRVFCHGRDPLFPAWTDTAQVNYFSAEARELMINRLLMLTEFCDGVRCDMAMLQLNNVFQNTWLGVLSKTNFPKPADEFWKIAIEKVKNKRPDFIFLAEAYWNLEWELQQLGFDFTYDKKLTDRLASEKIYPIVGHLEAEKEYQIKSARFLENHDETRAIIKFGRKQSLAAAVLISTIQGMKLYFDGQFEGKKVKLPVQLGREPEEKVSEPIKEFYTRLLSITKSEIFREGEWKMLEPSPTAPDNNTYENMLAWQWKLGSQYRLVVINYSEDISQCRLKFDMPANGGDIRLTDLLHNINYMRSTDEISTIGLFIELENYHCHIFSFEIN
ncbi:MAG: alpha-amylase family glycosyl hydrolase, partial [Ignavibacteriaceae bacterium]|nr:alpha-amylase family glycosyl hydrolase [Ignavibacteriaceae bacterium]